MWHAAFLKEEVKLFAAAEPLSKQIACRLSHFVCRHAVKGCTLIDSESDNFEKDFQSHDEQEPPPILLLAPCSPLLISLCL